MYIEIKKFKPKILLIIISACFVLGSKFSYSNNSKVIEEIKVVATTTRSGLALDPESLPMLVQSLDLEFSDVSHMPALGDILSQRFAGVTLNMAQNNPLQPDLQFRGYTASPLLGLPQGIAIYQNGVRLNTPFGETINWELIPLGALDQVDLIAGANPLFGLNSLGGVFSLQMKNGFTFDESWVDVSAGSFGRNTSAFEWGTNSGNSAFYIYASGFEEEGWRDHSKSRVDNFYSAFTHRFGDHELEFNVQLGDGSLRGNGPAPKELLDIDDAAVFTHPDITDNRLARFGLDYRFQLSDNAALVAGIYGRRLGTESFNGDGTEFEECDDAGDEVLVSAFEDVDNNDACNSALDSDIEYVVDGNGVRADSDLDAVNNRSDILQRDWGADLQLEWDQSLFGIPSSNLLGLTLRRSITEFSSQVELAQLSADRGTLSTGRFVLDEATELLTRTDTMGLFWGSQLFLTDSLTATLAARFHQANIKVRDRSGAHQELDGSHRFNRVSMAAGASYTFSDELSGYVAFNQAVRTPTPIELSCADPAFECRLPNAFLADPPLEQVVVNNWEAGFRGDRDNWSWQMALFYSENKNDIIFQSTGGIQGNQGFFDNIDSTNRLGVNLVLKGDWDAVSWFANYSYLEATYGEDWLVSSTNHPLADENGQLLVERGDRLPGLPKHNIQMGLDYSLTSKLSLSVEGQFSSSVYLRGDEANRMRSIPSYATFSTGVVYQLSDRVILTARADNIFDSEYDSFGLLGEPEEILGDDFQNPVFLSRGAPRAAWLGIRVRLD